jgi:hypothetical protein
VPRWARPGASGASRRGQGPESGVPPAGPSNTGRPPGGPSDRPGRPDGRPTPGAPRAGGPDALARSPGRSRPARPLRWCRTREDLAESRELNRQGTKFVKKTRRSGFTTEDTEGTEKRKRGIHFHENMKYNLLKSLLFLSSPCPLCPPW